MNKYHDSEKYDVSPRDGGTLCFDCHDPHGDRASGTGNIFMIQNDITVNKADAYGTPGTTATTEFIDRTSGGSYAKENPGSPGTYFGVCQVCHYDTTNHRADGTGNQTHGVSGDTCIKSGCHLHEVDTTVDHKAFFLATSGDACSDCHSAAGGATPGTTPDAGHANHIQTAYVGSLAAGDYGNYATNNWYEFTNVGGVPDIKCGNCHPQGNGTHANGTTQVYYDPTDRGADSSGSVKALNKSTGPWYSGSGDSITCDSVYCHSTGYKNPSTGEYEYVVSPAWGTGSFTDIAEDRCAGCHGNSPNSTDSIAGLRVGSLSHYNTDYMGQGVMGGHFVGIHYDNVYTGTTGLATTGSNPENSHGDGTTSTTINCNTCHNATVTSTANDQNEVCITCHEGTTAALRGNMDIAAGSTVHVNGTPEVVFENITFNSKPQVRDDSGDLTNLPEIDNYWTRTNSYKAGATSYDASKASLNNSLYSNGTCSSVACHNGIDVAWDDQKVDCLTCHTALLR
jgi:predicted CxxxxCH...CXXCH cytochrome family protein